MGVVAGVLGGIASGIGSWLGNNEAADAKREATRAQERWQQKQLAEARPYLDAGAAAMEKRNALLGLSGDEEQANALAALSDDQNWQAQLDAINDSVSRNAVAKGQTGGNLLAALADRAQKYKYGQIQDYLGNLQGDINTGQNALSQMGSVGSNAVNNISNLTAGAGQSSGAGLTGLFQGAGNALTAYQRQQGRKNLLEALKGGNNNVIVGGI